MKRTEPKSFAQIFDENMALAGATDTLAEHRACYLWSEIVGPGVNRYTFKRYIEQRVMHVYITSAPLKNELAFHRQSLVDKINQAVGANVIDRIEFH